MTVLSTVFLSTGLPAKDPLNNESILKLAKAGMTDDFIVDVIQQQPGTFSTDVPRLVELKNGGVSEPVIAAMIRKTPPAEALTSDGVISLVKARFSEQFVIDQIRRSQAKFSTGADRLVEMKSAGVSEAILKEMVGQSAIIEIPADTSIGVRMIDEIDSAKAKQGDRFRASLSQALVINGQTVADRGADAVVQLVEEKEAGKLTGTTELKVELVSLTIGGKPVDLTTDAFTKESGSRGKQTATRSAIGAGLGAVIGAIAGGGKGAAIGAGAGAGAGVGTQVITKGQRITIPSETLLTFRTKTAVKV